MAPATFNGDLSWYNNDNQPFGGPGDVVVNGNIYGNQVASNQFKQGAGKLTITGTNYEGGAGAGTVNLSFPLWGGTVVLDYTTNNTNKLGVVGTGQLVLSNVNLQVNGNANAPTVQTVGGSGGTKLNQPGNTISVTTNGGQNATLNLGAITRANSATGDFQLTNTSGGVAAITTTTNNLSGILTPTISAPGTGYTTAPTVTFNTPTGGSAATGIAVVNAGAVVGIIITNPGSGYTSVILPTITFGTVAGASGAAATGNFGSYGYLGGWATLQGTSFATGATGGATTTIGAATFGTQVAPGKLLDVGTGNASATPFTDATNATYAAAGITNGVVAGIRFNDANANPGVPNTLKIAAGQNLWISDNNGGNAAGGIIDTANTGTLAPSVITGGEISFGVNGSFTIAQYNPAQPLRIDSQINSASSGAVLVKTGPGELQLTNATINAGINVYGGTVTANSPGAMGTGTSLGNGTTFKYAPITNPGSSGGLAATWANKVTLYGPATFDNEGGTLTFSNTGNDFGVNNSVPWDLTITGSGDITLTGGISLGATYTSPNNTTLSTITPGFGQLIKTGTNNLTINGTSTISGGVVINNGTVTLANATDTLPNNEPISINASTATLAMSGSDAVGPVTLNAGSINGAGTLQAMAYNFNSGTVSAKLTGIVGIYKDTAGTVTVSGSNTFTGPTTINAGTLSINSIQTVGGGGSALGAPATAVLGTIAMGNVASGATLVYTGTGNTTDRILSLTSTIGGITIDQSGTGLLKFTSPLSIPGTAGVDNRKTLTLQGSAAGTGQFAGAIVDSALGTTGQTATTLVKAGTGTWIISSTSNTYTGGTTIQNGTLQLGAANTLPTSTTVTFGTPTTNGALDLNGLSQQIAALAIGTGAAPASQIIGNSSTTANGTLVFAGGTSTFAGTIQDVLGTGNQKTALSINSGKLTLSGTNTFTGGTTINNATMAGSADAALGATASPVTINGGTLELTSGFTSSRTVTLGTGSPIIQVDAGTQSLTLAGTGTLTKAGSGQLNLASLPASFSITAGTLQLTAGATDHTLASPTTVAISGGKMDLTNNDLYINGGASTIFSLLGKVTTSTVGPTNNTSTPATLAIALLSGSEYIALGKTDNKLDGTVVGPTDLVGVLAYAGDANLDGKITVDDYMALNLGFLFGLKGWTHGDFAQTGGAVMPADYAIIDTNYLNQSGVVADSEIALHTQWFGAAYTDAFNALNAPATVPEPASLALLAAGAMGLLRRKSRK